MRASKHRGDLPTTEQLRGELSRLRTRKGYIAALRATVGTLIVIAAASVLICTFLFSVLRIEGSSMTPALRDGEYVLAFKAGDYVTGDLLAFYYNNKILIKRVIGLSLDWVDIDEEGRVLVNDMPLEEPYVSDPSYGDGDVEFPYQVPAHRWFVLGDRRGISADSRTTSIGTVSKDQIVGKVVLRIWPLSEFALLK